LSWSRGASQKGATAIVEVTSGNAINAGIGGCVVKALRRAEKGAARNGLSRPLT
jgi:hypothetical protein